MGRDTVNPPTTSAELFAVANSALMSSHSVENQVQTVEAEARMHLKSDGSVGDLEAIQVWAQDAIERTQKLLDELHRVREGAEAMQE